MNRKLANLYTHTVASRDGISTIRQVLSLRKHANFNNLSNRNNC